MQLLGREDGRVALAIEGQAALLAGTRDGLALQIGASSLAVRAISH